MKTHEFFQMACTDLPDREVVAAQILAQPAPRRHITARYLATAAVAAVILAAGLTVLPHGGPAAPTPAPLPSEHPVPVTGRENPTEPEDPAEQPEQPPEEPEEPVPETFLYINDVTELAADGALNRLLIQNAQQWSLPQVLEYLACDPRPASLPAGLEPTFDENSTWMYSEAEDGLALWAQFGFSWCEHPDSEEYDPLERRLDMTVSRGEIFNCCVYVFPDEMVPSSISGTEVMLGHRQMGYGPYTVVEDGPNIPAGYFDVYVAQFQHHGLSYEVISENLTQEEFVSALEEMLAV